MPTSISITHSGKLGRVKMLVFLICFISHSKRRGKKHPAKFSNRGYLVTLKHYPSQQRMDYIKR